MTVTLPLPPQSGHGRWSSWPDPLQVEQMSSPVCLVPGASSSPGFFLSPSTIALSPLQMNVETGRRFASGWKVEGFTSGDMNKGVPQDAI